MSLPRTLQERPAVRLFNRVGAGARRLGWKGYEFRPERLEAEALRKTGLADLGSPRYRVPLERLCASYENDAELTTLGRIIQYRTLEHLLENRARLQDDLTTHPEILHEEIRRPLYVLGLPRTGTTFLYNLLSQDPACRPLLFWETMSPSPPPTPETRQSDPRRAKAQRHLQQMNRAVPDFADIHKLVADGPEECLGLLMNSFFNPFFYGQIPDYRRWLEEIPDSEIVAVYADYKTQLQLLQWKVKGQHWILKCPTHLLGMAGLLENFPDAAVVHTHRDLARSVPSLCSLIAAADTLCYRHVDRREVGQNMLRTADLLLNRGLAGRDRAGGDRVLDVAYADTVRDPTGTVERIYAHFGYDFTPAFRDRLKQFLATDKHASKKLHSYTLEEFGLSGEQLQKRYAGYLERFHIAPER